MVIEGILRTDNAKRAIDIEADTILVSNHGAKIFDGTPSSLSLLPEICEEVRGQIEVFVDCGIRRGAEVVRACAYGGHTNKAFLSLGLSSG